MLKLLILANCQATALGSMFSGIRDASGEAPFDVLPCPPVFELGPDDRELLLSFLAQCDVLLYQPHQGWANTPRWRTSEYWCELTGGKTISFQSLYFSAYNPELTYLKVADGSHLNGGFSDYHDRCIAHCFLEGYSQEQALQSYRKLPLGERFIRDNAEASMAETRLRERQQQLDVRVSRFMASRYLKQQLFFTFNHPANRVLNEVCRQVMQLLGLEGMAVPKQEKALLGYDRFPVARATQRALGLEFDVSKGYVIQHQRMSPAEVVARYYAVYREHRAELEASRELIQAPWAG